MAAAIDANPKTKNNKLNKKWSCPKETKIKLRANSKEISPVTITACFICAEVTSPEATKRFSPTLLASVPLIPSP